MSEVDRMTVIARWECERCGAEPEDRTATAHPDPDVRGSLCYGRIVEVEYVPRSTYRGAVLAPEIAATAATLVDVAKRSLPPHISEAQQVEAYLALRRIAGGQ